MKHTPGPWQIKTGNGWAHIYIDDMSGNTVAECAHWRSNRNDCSGNACLIAVAPDLLQAASDAYARLLSLGQYYARHTMQGQSELAALVHAIAKATGRANQDVQDEFEAREIMRVPE